MIPNFLKELLAPLGCAACDEPTSRLFCQGCAATTELSADPGAAFVYGGAVAEAIVKLKYRGRSDLAARLGRAMIARSPRSVDLVVPVPLHPRRASERGFNQSALLARDVARALGIPLGARVLERTRDTPRQTALERAKRIMNVRSAFRCREPRRVVGKRILLVDDVRTTGATLGACGRTLADAGAREILPYVLALADNCESFVE